MALLKLLLIIVAAIFFAFDFFQVKFANWTPSWTPGGFCLLTIALLLIK
jgi:hypothetical protein